MFDIWGLLFEFGYFLGADAYYYRNMKGPYKDHLVVQLEVQHPWDAVFLNAGSKTEILDREDTETGMIVVAQLNRGMVPNKNTAKYEFSFCDEN